MARSSGELPGAFEGETVTRRRFMTRIANATGAVGAAAITLPALGFALGPVFDRAPATWQTIGPLSRFNRSDDVPVVFTVTPGQVLLGPRFSVNSELRRFAPRAPGEPLDGIGQFLYPARLSTPPAPPGAKP
jgi:hypothetical protein